MLEFICSVPSALSVDVQFSIYLLRAVHMTHSQRQFKYARSDELHLCTGGSKPDYLAIAQVLKQAADHMIGVTSDKWKQAMIRVIPLYIRPPFGHN